MREPRHREVKGGAQGDAELVMCPSQDRRASGLNPRQSSWRDQREVTLSSSLESVEVLKGGLQSPRYLGRSRVWGTHGPRQRSTAKAKQVTLRDARKCS